MAFQPIRRILPDSIRHAGIDEQVSSVRILTLAQSLLEKFWGSEKAAYIEWISYKDGALRVRSQASAALQELRVWEPRLINELNRELRVKKVVKIVQV
ncbi:DUF721 domain-containing protein [Patescibacteria group bacterium]|nr:DUF721 domain-containing protein [Patescibacteria group bacterium]